MTEVLPKDITTGSDVIVESIYIGFDGETVMSEKGVFRFYLEPKESINPILVMVDFGEESRVFNPINYKFYLP
jgi:hypothetical protein